MVLAYTVMTRKPILLYKCGLISRTNWKIHKCLCSCTIEYISNIFYTFCKLGCCFLLQRKTFEALGGNMKKN